MKILENWLKRLASEPEQSWSERHHYVREDVAGAPDTRQPEPEIPPIIAKTEARAFNNPFDALAKSFDQISYSPRGGFVLLNERQATHGSYGETAITAQDIKGLLRTKDTPRLRSPHMNESLDLIATKLARIVHGNPNEADHWRDIAGYANLIVERLESQPKGDKP